MFLFAIPLSLMYLLEQIFMFICDLNTELLQMRDQTMTLSADRHTCQMKKRL